MSGSVVQRNSTLRTAACPLLPSASMAAMRTGGRSLSRCRISGSIAAECPYAPRACAAAVRIQTSLSSSELISGATPFSGRSRTTALMAARRTAGDSSVSDSTN